MGPLSSAKATPRLERLKGYVHSARAQFIITLLGGVAVSCVEPDLGSSYPEWAGTQRLEEGVLVTANPASPAVGPTAVTIEEVWRGVGEDWEGPSHLAVANQNVYVLDPLARTVHVVAFDGSQLGAIGQPGEGPGEFLRPYAVAVCDKRIVVADGGKSSLEIFDGTGSFLKRVHVGRVSFSMEPLADCRFLMRTLLGDEDQWVVLDLEGQQVSLKLPNPRPLSARYYENCGGVTSAAGYLIRLSCVTPMFELLTMGDSVATIAKVISVDRPPVATPPAVLARLKNEMLSQVREVGYTADRATALVEELIDDFKQIRDIRKVVFGDSLGTFVMLQQTPPELETSDVEPTAVLHFFSTEGIYFAAIAVAERVVDYALSGSSLFALVEDSQTGLVTLARYRLQLDETAIRAVTRRIQQSTPYPR